MCIRDRPKPAGQPGSAAGTGAWRTAANRTAPEAVSYTHLDVYKRQLKYVVSAFDVRGEGKVWRTISIAKCDSEVNDCVHPLHRPINLLEVGNISPDEGVEIRGDVRGKGDIG